MNSKLERKEAASRLHDLMAAHVAAGDLPGLVTLTSVHDETHVDALGALRVGGGEPMARDAIFRITSMTKPMATAVAMMLVEDGTLPLDASVERWLPELANRRVLRRIDAALDDTVPAERSITVRDVLTFRMGFGLVWGPPDALPVQREANALRLGAFGPPMADVPPAPDEWMRRFATLPLMAQPGERWMYTTSAEVLGVLLARASGKPLDVLLRERLFAPLGMKDTGFFVPADEMQRFATSYMPTPGGALEVYDPAQGGAWSRPPAFPSAAGGLVSTVDDCFAFARMMVGRGALGAVRVLSPRSIEMMTTDSISADQEAASGGSLDPSFWTDFGWGMGLAIVRRNQSEGPRGCGWDGGLGTAMWWDARRGAIAILMTQRAAYPKMSAVHCDFWRAVNEGA